MTRKRKPVLFHGTSLGDLREFPEAARREAGFQIDKLQAFEKKTPKTPLRDIELARRRYREVPKEVTS